jgi:AraC-like DNA-binding protein
MPERASTERARARPEQLARPSADPLGAVLHGLRVNGVFYCHSELTEPWGLTLPPMPGCLWFHVLLAGRCRLHGRSLPATSLAPGDFALVPRGEGHCLKSTPGVATPTVTDLPHEIENERYAFLRHGGGGAPSTLVCGVVRVDHHAADDIAALAPPLILLDALRSPQAEWMQTTVRLMATEARQAQPGGETIVTRLADILVVQAIRSWLATEAASEVGWLHALRDPALGRAIGLMHREPEKDWSVTTLAARVAMSRSAFAGRFTQLAGETPMSYLTRVRMRAAREQLARPGTTIADVALRSGYRSEAAFSRAFKRVLGVAPGSQKASRRKAPSSVEP